MGRHARTGIAAALAITAALAGCAGKAVEGPAASSPSPSPMDPMDPLSPTTTVSPRTEKWTALQAGDCLAEAPPTDPAVVTVTLVDCSDPHLAETYLRANIPVDAALDVVATDRCNTGFAEYTGRPVGAGAYTVTYLIDSDQDRTGNNPYPSTVICLLQDAGGGSLTGSAKG